ncbi:alpha-ketoglutarate-dependent dioxygenase AlkB [Gammaproteobacteria bacterium]|nr:alpha-ketoglutarate-dependent dioxygenase AlkB [Gammaproteobacteria bacterium]
MQNLQIPFNLEQSPESIEQWQLADADIQLFPHFLSTTEADLYFDDLKKNMPWQQDSLNFGGKSVLIPRLQVWVGDKQSRYTYSGLSLSPLPWTPVLEKLRKLVEKASNSEFNSVLLNYYRDGSDSVAWHSDDEKELGSEPTIASLSLGVSRCFQLKYKTNWARTSSVNCLKTASSKKPQASSLSKSKSKFTRTSSSKICI